MSNLKLSTWCGLSQLFLVRFLRNPRDWVHVGTCRVVSVQPVSDADKSAARSWEQELRQPFMQDRRCKTWSRPLLPTLLSVLSALGFPIQSVTDRRSYTQTLLCCADVGQLTAETKFETSYYILNLSDRESLSWFFCCVLLATEALRT